MRRCRRRCTENDAAAADDAALSDRSDSFDATADDDDVGDDVHDATELFKFLLMMIYL